MALQTTLYSTAKQAVIPAAVITMGTGCSPQTPESCYQFLADVQHAKVLAQKHEDLENRIQERLDRAKDYQERSEQTDSKAYALRGLGHALVGAGKAVLLHRKTRQLEQTVEKLATHEGECVKFIPPPQEHRLQAIASPVQGTSHQQP